MQDMYKGFKKIAEDNNAALLEHENGHKLHIAKSGLSKKHLKTLEKLPIHKYDGGANSDAEKIAALEEEMAAAKAGMPVAEAPQYSGTKFQPTEEQLSQRPENIGYKLGQAIGRGVIDPLVQSASDVAGAYGKIGSAAVGTMGEAAKGAVNVAKDVGAGIINQPMPQTYRAPSYDETQVSQPVSQPPKEPQLAEPQQEPAKPAVSAEAATAQAAPKIERQAAALPQKPQAPGMVLSKDEMVMMDPNANPYDRAMATQNVVNTRIMARKKADEEFYKEMMKPENDIKIQNYFHDKNALQTIVGALSLIAGGVSGGLLKTENPAMKLIENAINRELEVQKLSKERKLNLYKMHREAEGDEMNAMLQSANNLKQLVQMKADQMMGLTPGTPGTAGNKLFGLRLDKAKSDLETGIQENRIKQAQMDVQKLQQEIKQQAFRGTATSGAPGQAGLSATNPSILVDSLFKDNEKDKENANKELRHRLEINAVAPKLLKLFDEIDSPMPSPGAEAAFQGLLTTLVPKIEGGQSLGAMEATRSKYTPNKYLKIPGGNKRIRESLVTWLTSGSADPTWQKYGKRFSLDNFAATAHPWAQETVRRITKDGKVAIFDSKTKQFMGYE